jgi:hypothetical protein
MSVVELILSIGRESAQLMSPRFLNNGPYKRGDKMFQIQHLICYCSCCFLLIMDMGHKACWMIDGLFAFVDAERVLRTYSSSKLCPITYAKPKRISCIILISSDDANKMMQINSRFCLFWQTKLTVLRGASNNSFLRLLKRCFCFSIHPLKN